MMLAWPIHSPYAISYWWSIRTERQSVYLQPFLRYWALRALKSHDLDLSESRDLTSSVTWPFDVPWAISYLWSLESSLSFQASISNGFQDILPQPACTHRHNAESSLRMRDITWYELVCNVQVHILISYSQFAYSLCHFIGLRWGIRIFGPLC